MGSARPVVRGAGAGSAVVIVLSATSVGGRAAPHQVGAAPRPRVDIGAAERLPCTRAGLAQSVMAFVGLVHEGRYSSTPRLWVPKRLPTPAFFRIVRGRPIRAELPRELPAATRTWRADQYRELEVVVVNPVISRRPRTSSSYGVAWTRTNPEDGSIRFGQGKGVWG